MTKLASYDLNKDRESLFTKIERTFDSYNVVVRPTPPKLRLAYHIEVSPEFRTKFDQWLLDRFGFIDDEDKILLNTENNLLIMSPKTYNALSKLPNL